VDLAHIKQCLEIWPRLDTISLIFEALLPLQKRLRAGNSFLASLRENTLLQVLWLAFQHELHELLAVQQDLHVRLLAFQQDL
jgi:hypothetical protein